MSFRENNKLRPLSRLSVIRDLYCTQPQADKIILYLSNEFPEKCISLLEKTGGARAPGYFMALDEIIYKAKDQFKNYFSNTDDNLAWIDLSYELDRRLRSAYDLPEIKIAGSELAPGPDGPYKQLKIATINDKDVMTGLKQEDVESILNHYYHLYPKEWYYYAEAIRRQTSHRNNHSASKAVEEISADLKVNLSKTAITDVVSKIFPTITMTCEI